ncbi:MAG: NAD(P)-dependent alcohol dehydrogenase [Chloroflexi bacterium]|nr:NAD(P)-dependent alcohol dehydrogenase [Chloroflexota bacterium]
MLVNAAVLREQGQPFVLEELELDEPRGDEVLVRIVGAGICHTDLLFRDDPPWPRPAVLGHEGAGVVERVGNQVITLRPGDQVVLSFLSCGACRNCRRGMPIYCPEGRSLNFGGTRRDGSSALCDADGPLVGHFFGQSSFATYALASERNAVKVADDAPLELLGPLGCGVQTGAGSVLNALRPTPGSQIAIFGAGSVGLSAVMAAATSGCATIIAIDLKPARLELALALGATHVLNGAEVDAVDAIRSITHGGADYALETAGAGSPALIRQAVECLTTPGVCGLVGAAPPDLELTLSHSSLFWGRTVRGIGEGESVPQAFIPALVDLHARGRFPLERLVSFYPLHDINRAAADAEEGLVVKPVLRPAPE